MSAQDRLMFRTLMGNYHKAERDRAEQCLADILQILSGDDDDKNRDDIIKRLIEHYQRGSR